MPLSTDRESTAIEEEKSTQRRCRGKSVGRGSLMPEETNRESLDQIRTSRKKELDKYGGGSSLIKPKHAKAKEAKPMKIAEKE